MKFNICKINHKDINGTGFFCNIPFCKTKIPVLITNYHIIGNEILEKNNLIKISYNDEKIAFILELDKERKIYLSPEDDITIIELKEKDGIKNLLELDENLFNDKSEYLYDSKSIYILQYPNGNKSSVSFGNVNNINNKNIYHICSTENGSSGSPILNLFNNKVIGIHKEGSIYYNYNIGSFLKKPIKEFYEQNSNNFGLIGLNKLGETCSENAVLQCLSQTKSLTSYFLNKKFRERIINNNIIKENKDEPSLSPSYLQLLEILWDKNNNNKYYSPSEFMKKVVEIRDPNFKSLNYYDYDCEGLIFFILEQLHKELKSSEKLIDDNLINEPLNQYDPKSAINHFLKDFQDEQSIISDLFIGVTETTIICLHCKNEYNSKNMMEPIIYHYQMFY